MAEASDEKDDKQDWRATVEHGIDRFFDWQEKESENNLKTARAEAEQNKRITRYALVFFGFFGALLVILTFAERMSGEVLVFYLGTVVGYVYSIVMKLLTDEVVYEDTLL